MSLSPNSQNLSLDTKRHSMAHIMAAAVGQMFPEVQYGVGPVIENGCYYDFILPRTLIPEDLPLIEEKMRELLKQHLAFKVQEVSILEAIELFEKNNQPLKVELLNDLRTRGTTSMSVEEKENFELSESLMGELKIEIPEKRRKGNGKFLTLKGATGHNLKNVDLKIYNPS